MGDLRGAMGAAKAFTSKASHALHKGKALAAGAGLISKQPAVKPITPKSASLFLRIADRTMSLSRLDREMRITGFSSDTMALKSVRVHHLLRLSFQPKRAQDTAGHLVRAAGGSMAAAELLLEDTPVEETSSAWPAMAALLVVASNQQPVRALLEKMHQNELADDAVEGGSGSRGGSSGAFTHMVTTYLALGLKRKKPRMEREPGSKARDAAAPLARRVTVNQFVAELARGKWQAISAYVRQFCGSHRRDGSLLQLAHLAYLTIKTTAHFVEDVKRASGQAKADSEGGSGLPSKPENLSKLLTAEMIRMAAQVVGIADHTFLQLALELLTGPPEAMLTRKWLAHCHIPSVLITRFRASIVSERKLIASGKEALAKFCGNIFGRPKLADLMNTLRAVVSTMMSHSHVKYSVLMSLIADMFWSLRSVLPEQGKALTLVSGTFDLFASIANLDGADFAVTATTFISELKKSSKPKPGGRGAGNSRRRRTSVVARAGMTVSVQNPWVQKVATLLSNLRPVMELMVVAEGNTSNPTASISPSLSTLVLTGVGVMAGAGGAAAAAAAGGSTGVDADDDDEDSLDADTSLERTQVLFDLILARHGLDRFTVNKSSRSAERRARAAAGFAHSLESTLDAMDLKTHAADITPGAHASYFRVLISHVAGDDKNFRKALAQLGTQMGIREVNALVGVMFGEYRHVVPVMELATAAGIPALLAQGLVGIATGSTR